MYKIIDIGDGNMPKRLTVLLPEIMDILEQMRLQIKYTRLRRKISSELVAESIL